MKVCAREFAMHIHIRCYCLAPYGIKIYKRSIIVVLTHGVTSELPIPENQLEQMRNY